MLVEESRIFQVSTFGTLNLHQTKLDQDQVLLDVVTIADELIGNSRKPGIVLRRQNRPQPSWVFNIEQTANRKCSRLLTYQAKGLAQRGR
jgi:hypothetical protein